MDHIEEREKEDIEKDFRINNYITLKLERNLGRKITYIYIKAKKFCQCIRLVIEIPKEHVRKFDDINSIEEAAEIVDEYLLENNIVKEEHAILANDVHCNIPLNVRIACLIPQILI